MPLKTADKKVLVAFSNQKKAEGHLLSSDGKTLEKLGMGRQKIAWWDGHYVHVEPSLPHVKSDEVIIRALRKVIPKNWLKEDTMVEAKVPPAVFLKKKGFKRLKNVKDREIWGKGDDRAIVGPDDIQFYDSDEKDMLPSGLRKKVWSESSDLDIYLAGLRGDISESKGSGIKVGDMVEYGDLSYWVKVVNSGKAKLERQTGRYPESIIVNLDDRKLRKVKGYYGRHHD